MALGPHPQRELSLTPRLGFARPRLGVAAGAASFTGAGAPPPARAIADTSPRICSSSARCGRRRYVFHWRWGIHPRRELSVTPRLGFARPRLGVAAGATSFTGAGAPPQRELSLTPRLGFSRLRLGVAEALATHPAYLPYPNLLA